MMFTYNEVIKGIMDGQEGSLNLSFDEAAALSKILLNRGYAVLLTGGDFKDEVRVDWKYAGNINDLKYADRKNIVFGSPDYVQILIDDEYIHDEED